MLVPWKKSYDKPRQHVKKQRHYFANKDLYTQSYGFSGSCIWMRVDHKEGWALKNWCFQTFVLEKTPKSPLYSREIKVVYLKGNQPCILSGRTEVEAEAIIVWPPDAKSQLIGKDPDAGKDWGQEEKETTEEEMVGWHHWFNGHEFEQALGDGGEQGYLAWCSPWDHKQLDTTEWLNNSHHLTNIFLSFPLNLSGFWSPMFRVFFWSSYIHL